MSLRAGAGLLDRLERGAPDEVALLELHDPPEVDLERVRVAVELVAVQRHAGLEAQRVARSEPARPEPVTLAGGQQRRPTAPARGGASQKSSKPSSPV